jgi:hypothetical protein
MRGKLSAERARLADLIERLGVAADYAAQCQAAIDRAPSVYDAAAARDAAEAALAEAKQNEARFQVIALISSSKAESPVAAAEAALATADAELAKARQIRDMLEGELNSANAAVALRRSYLRDAVGRVLLADPAPAALLREYKAAKARLAEICDALRVISAANGLPSHWDSEGGADHRALSAAATIWRQAIAALELDAAAALPGVLGRD